MGYSSAPLKHADKVKKGHKSEKKDRAQPPKGSIRVVFENKGEDPKFNGASLYYQETLWGDFGPGKSHSVNSFQGHVWYVKGDNGEGESSKEVHSPAVVAYSNPLNRSS